MPRCGRTSDRVGDAVRTATMGAPGHGREKCAPVHEFGDEADAIDPHQSDLLNYSLSLNPGDASVQEACGARCCGLHRLQHEVMHPAARVSRPGIHRSTCREDASAFGPRGLRQRPRLGWRNRRPVRSCRGRPSSPGPAGRSPCQPCDGDQPPGAAGTPGSLSPKVPRARPKRPSPRGDVLLQSGNQRSVGTG